MNVYSKLQDIVAEREPFNEDAIRFREKEDIAYLIGNICKGLEIIDGVELVYSKVNDGRDNVYQNKKSKHDLTKEEVEEMRQVNTRNKGTNKSKNSMYPLTSISQSRYLDIEFKMRYTDSKTTEEVVYHLNYPELVNGEYFLLNGNKFYPIFQLADAEYYRTGRNAIVLKTTFMPITVRANKTHLKDHADQISIDTRLYELSLFSKHINAFLYFFAKFGVTESLERLKVADHVEFIFEGMDEYTIEEGDDSYFFKLTSGISLKVNREWMDSDLKFNSSIINTISNIFSRKHITEENFYDIDYWMKQLGRQFTSNTNKAYDKAYSIIISVERLLDVTTRNNMRNPEEEKKDVFTAIFGMVENFENILRIDNYDLANKRIRVAEYLLYPFTHKLSKSVYRLISSRNPPISKLKQIFSSVDEDFIVSKLNSITLIRFNNQVNTMDLFTRILKGSKAGPQSQSMDNSGSSIGVRGIDPSYAGLIDLASTSSNDPGVSFTVTPFASVYDPNDNNNFYFTNAPNIDNFNPESDNDQLINIDSIITEDEFSDDDIE